MPNVEPGSFGLAIAFLAPGIVGLWGIGQHVETVREWFGATAQTQATGAGFYSFSWLHSQWDFS